MIYQKENAKNNNHISTSLRRTPWLLIVLALFSAMLMSGCERAKLNLKESSTNEWGSTNLILENTGKDLRNVKIKFESFGVDKNKTATRNFDHWNKNEIKHLQFGSSEMVTDSETLVISIYQNGEKIHEETWKKQ